MKGIIIGERYNKQRVLQLEQLLRDDPAAWVDESLRLTAFPPPAVGRQRLVDIGVRWGESDSMNLLTPAPQYEPWDDRLACAVAALVLARGYDKVVIVGRRASRCFLPWEPKLRHVSWAECPKGFDRRFVVVPHPSGRNYWWNEASYDVIRARLDAWYAT